MNAPNVHYALISGASTCIIMLIYKLKKKRDVNRLIESYFSREATSETKWFCFSTRIIETSLPRRFAVKRQREKGAEDKRVLLLDSYATDGAAFVYLYIVM